jgi:L-ascorbate metabolism protein UlaG (beta-lactamase superfamily)
MWNRRLLAIPRICGKWGRLTVYRSFPTLRTELESATHTRKFEEKLMRLQLIRNATLRLSYGGQEILIDPCFGAKGSLPSFAGIAANPTVEMPASANAVFDGIDLTVISHLHPDHFDAAAEASLPKQIPIFSQPKDMEAIREKGFTEVTALINEASWKGLSLKRTAGQHGTGEILAQMGSVMGFILKAQDEPTLYWAGDTVLIPEVLSVLAKEKPDVIVTHSGGANVGGTLLVMDDAQTVELSRNAGEAIVIAVHMEALDHCPVTRAQLRAAANAAGIPETQLLIPADGQQIDL